MIGDSANTVSEDGAGLTELDFFILGLISEGITSGYAMRRVMNSFRGSRWSAESGAIYRVLRRLLSRELVEDLGRAGAKRRERTEYGLTIAGRDVLRTWVCAIPSESEISYLVDPIRTRAYFLPRLPREDRNEVVERWIEASQAFIDSLPSESQGPDISVKELTPLQNEAYANLLYLARARHTWLLRLRHLSNETSDPSPSESD